MKTKRLSLNWQGTFIELCMNRVHPALKERIDGALAGSGQDLRSSWYDNRFLLKSLFDADNWWSVDNLDHSMGLVFGDRSHLEAGLTDIHYTLDGKPVTVDPDALQLSFYAPEFLDDPLDADERIMAHGILREVEMHLEAEVDAPFDPSLITLSFLRYPNFGYILIDLDYDGHDDARFTWGGTTHLQPRFFGKDDFDDAAT